MKTLNANPENEEVINPCLIILLVLDISPQERERDTTLKEQNVNYD